MAAEQRFGVVWRRIVAIHRAPGIYTGMDEQERRLTKKAQRVLLALNKVAPNGLYGIQLMDAANVPAGSAYPILVMFVERGWVEATPRKQPLSLSIYYRITHAGMRVAESLSDQPAPSWPWRLSPDDLAAGWRRT